MKTIVPWIQTCKVNSNNPYCVKKMFINTPTPWHRIFLEQFTVTQLMKKFPVVFKYEGSMTEKPKTVFCHL
jgi:hypothetical protein